MKKIIIPVLLCYVLMLYMQFAVQAEVMAINAPGQMVNGDGLGYSGVMSRNMQGGSLEITGYSEWPSSFSKKTADFSGSVYSGNRLWMIPGTADMLVSMQPDGTMAVHSDWPSELELGDYAFFGAVMRDNHAYLVPYNANGIVKLDTIGESMTMIQLPTEGMYAGGVSDGENIYMIPDGRAPVIMIDAQDQVTQIDSFPEDVTIPVNKAFRGGVFAGNSIWLIPYNASALIKLDLSDKTMTAYSWFPTDARTFRGACFDGNRIYLLPASKTAVVTVDPADGSMEAVTTWPENMPDDMEFAGGVFDGRTIYMSTYKGNKIIAFDVFYNTMRMISLPESMDLGTNPFIGGALFEGGVYLSPSDSKEVVKLVGTNTPPYVMNIFLTTNKEVPCQSSLTAIDPDSPQLKYRITASPNSGNVSIDADTGQFVYTPNKGYQGVDRFSFSVFDGDTHSNTAVVTLEVKGDDTERQMVEYYDMSDHWAEECVGSLAGRSVIQGEMIQGRYYFYPDYELTRINFLVLANAAFNLENQRQVNYKDIQDQPRWVVVAASKAAEAGMIPEEDEKLRPYQPLTRVEAVTMVYNLLEEQLGGGGQLSFSDKDDIPVWAREQVAAMYADGMVKGYEDNSFRPNEKVTRAQAAALLESALERKNGIKLRTRN